MMLPEGCVSAILRLTTPKDACRSATVSCVFKSALESDALWESFLPCDYHEIVSSLITPLSFKSKKELFFGLCSDVLVDGGTKSFKLVKSSGKKCYILSARELSIAWSEVPTYWSWIRSNESRFSEVAVLRSTCWLQIEGKIRSHMLSPNTKYGAYLILKIAERVHGLDSIPSETLVKVGNQVCTNFAYITCQQSKKTRGEECLSDASNKQVRASDLKEKKGQLPRERGDGWMEIELGQFFNGDCDEEVKMSMMEVKGYQLKGGIVIEGIELRPI